MEAAQGSGWLASATWSGFWLASRGKQVRALACQLGQTGQGSWLAGQQKPGRAALVVRASNVVLWQASMEDQDACIEDTNNAGSFSG